MATRWLGWRTNQRWRQARANLTLTLTLTLWRTNLTLTLTLTLALVFSLIKPAVAAGSLWRTSGAVLYASRRPA